MLRDLFCLFPAYAGVILRICKQNGGKNSFPRLRGGDPNPAERLIQLRDFSPPTRG